MYVFYLTCNLGSVTPDLGPQKKIVFDVLTYHAKMTWLCVLDVGLLLPGHLLPLCRLLGHHLRGGLGGVLVEAGDLANHVLPPLLAVHLMSSQQQQHSTFIPPPPPTKATFLDVLVMSNQQQQRHSTTTFYNNNIQYSSASTNSSAVLCYTSHV